MADTTIRSIQIGHTTHGDTTAAATVTYNGPWSDNFTVTHHFAKDGRTQQIHHSTNRHGYLGTMRDPERFGDDLDDSWVRNYINHRSGR